MRPPALFIPGCLLLTIIANATAAPPAFRFSEAYHSHMVLQREPLRASLWGYGPPGDSVTIMVSGGGDSHTATIDPMGRWRLSLPAMPASAAPVNVTARLSSSSSSSPPTVVLEDVLFGDVWVCSGQSNMAFTVSVPLNDPAAEAEIAKRYTGDPGATMLSNGTYLDAATAIATAATYDRVRIMVVGNKHDCKEPLEDWPTNGSMAVARPWARPSAALLSAEMDVMGGGVSAVCWYYGLELHLTQQNIPIGLIHTSYGGSAVEDWMSATTLGDGTSGPCPGPIVHSMGVPSNQYNGQLRPLLNTTIKGAIWYQGESNNNQDELYTCRFEQMMREWRAEWHAGTGASTDAAFPIGFVQVGPFGQQVGTPSTGDPQFRVRMGQTADYGYAPNARWPHTFMSTAFDLMNPPGTKCVAGCIHIFNKQAVAHRLALAARATVYGETVRSSPSSSSSSAAAVTTRPLVYSGPRVTGATQGATTNTVRVAYGGPGIADGEGLRLRGRYGFQVCYEGCTNETAAAAAALPIPIAQLMSSSSSSSSAGAAIPASLSSSTWFLANITAFTKDSVTVSGPPDHAGQQVAMIRYGHDDSPSIFLGTGPAIFNAEGLPATPGVWAVAVQQQ